MDPEHLKQLQSRLRAWRVERAAAAARLAALGDRLEPACLLALPTPIAGPLNWLVVRISGDSVEICPCDNRSLVLPGDVRIADTVGGFHTCRGIARAHVPLGRLRPEQRIDRLDADAIDGLQTDGPVGGSIGGADELFDEELNWAARLVLAAEATSAAVAADRPWIMRLRDWVDPARVLEPGRADAARTPSRRLAAASDAPEVEFAKLAASRRAIVEDLDLGYPGRIQLIATSRGVGLLCEPEYDEVPLPAVGWTRAGDPRWERRGSGPEHRIWTTVDWTREHVEFSLATGIPLRVQVRGEGAFES